jgi:hypothetical protein
MARNRASDVSEDTARILFLTYGQEAVEMAELRCRELAEAGEDNAKWRKVLEHVRKLASANPEGTSAGQLSHY